MTTGFKRNDGYDLDQLFMSGGTGVSGYPFTFQAYVQGTKQGATGFKNAAGTDMSDLFQNINVPLFTWRDNMPDLYDEGIGGAAYLYLWINRDGTASGGDWGTPTGGTPGDGWQVQFQDLGGGGFGGVGGTFGSWLALSSNRSIYIYATADYGQTRSKWNTIRVHFYRNSDAWQTYVDVYMEVTANYSDI